MTEKIMNLTQHKATEEQKRAGVIDIGSEEFYIVKELLTFDELPTRVKIEERAMALAGFASEWAKKYNTNKVMIGGAGYLMPYLIRYLDNVKLNPVFAFTKREVKEVKQDDGSVKKISVFKHEGFVEL